MSEKKSTDLAGVKVEGKARRNTHGPSSLTVTTVARLPKVSSRSHDFVYVNSAFKGSVDSVNVVRMPDPPTRVIREQYWACSKWPFAQKILALAVGVLFGTVIGLIVVVIIRGLDSDSIPDIFRTRAVAE